MKIKLLLILIITLFFNNAIARDKYVGRGNVILDDYEIKYFMEYLNPPAGQSPSIFMIAQEDEKSI